MKYGWLKTGDRVRIWPSDTYAKYAVVKELNSCAVTFEIVEVELGEPHYRPGQRITLPWSHVYVRNE